MKNRLAGAGVHLRGVERLRLLGRHALVFDHAKCFR